MIVLSFNSTSRNYIIHILHIILIYSCHGFHGFIKNWTNSMTFSQLLVECCTGITEVKALNPVKAWICPVFLQMKSCVYSCADIPYRKNKLPSLFIEERNNLCKTWTVPQAEQTANATQSQAEYSSLLVLSQFSDQPHRCLSHIGTLSTHSSHSFTTGAWNLLHLVYVHTIPDSFSWRHKKLSGIVWTLIRYVTLNFRDRRDAASLRHRNRAATTFLECEQNPTRYDFVVTQELSGIVWTLI